MGMLFHANTYSTFWLPPPAEKDSGTQPPPKTPPASRKDVVDDNGIDAQDDFVNFDQQVTQFETCLYTRM